MTAATLETMTAATGFDPARADAFVQRMIGLINESGMALMMSIGHRTRLFDTMAGLPPSTCDEIAQAAGLNERYVREWLGAMVTGRFVEYDPATGRYALPAEHAAFLTRASAQPNLAVTAQFVPVLASVEERIIECFRRGGGVPYQAYHRFHEVMAEESAQTVVRALVGHILPLVPGLPERLERGIDVLDVGCGSGRAIQLMAHVYPKSRFAGYDLSHDAIAAARAEAERQGGGNIRFAVQDMTRFDEEAGYDLITAFDAIHDQAQPAEVLRGIARALRPAGVFLMQDIGGSCHVHRNVDLPTAPFLYSISCMHCLSVSLSQNGAGLGAMWGAETALRMLDEAGFAEVTVHRLPHDIHNNYYVCTKG